MVARIVLAANDGKIPRTLIHALMVVHKLVMRMPMRYGRNLQHKNANNAQYGEDSREQSGHFKKLPLPEG